MCVRDVLADQEQQHHRQQHQQRDAGEQWSLDALRGQLDRKLAAKSPHFRLQHRQQRYQHQRRQQPAEAHLLDVLTEAQADGAANQKRGRIAHER